MTEGFSKEELLQLLQEKAPEELTEQEIEALQSRLPTSRTLQEALDGHLEIDSYLHAFEGEYRVSTDRIFTLASQRNSLTGRFLRWGIPLVLLLGCSAAAIYKYYPEEEPDRQIAENQQILDEQHEDTPGGELDPSHSQVPPETPQPGENPQVAEQDPEPVPQVNPQPETMPEVKPVAVAPPPDGPWKEQLAETKPVLPFEESALVGEWDADEQSLPPDELKEWLGLVDGHSYHVSEWNRNPQLRFGRLEGLARLKAPLREEEVLRLGLFSPESLKIHFWHNDQQGVTLHYTDQMGPALWGAYRTHREKQQARPDQMELLTTDNGIHQRSKLAVVELRYQDQSLVMTRGNMRLLTVPMPNPPSEIYFEGKVLFSELRMYRGKPAPPEPPNSRTIVLDAKTPAELPWMTYLQDGSLLVMDQNGNMELGGWSREKDVWAATPLPSAGLHEVIFQVASPQPGTGIYLGDINGEPLHRVGFFHEKRSGEVVLEVTPPGQVHTELEMDPAKHIVPYIGETVWVRMIAGLGTLQVFISPDGQHWGFARHYPLREWRPAVYSVGLYSLRGETHRSISLLSVEVREFTGITSLVAPELRQQAANIDFDQEGYYPAWLAAVARTVPLGVPFKDWLMACSLVTVERQNRSLSTKLLELMVVQGLHEERPWQDRLRMLEETALVLDVWEAHRASWLSDRYEELGQQVVREHGSPDAIVAIMQSLAGVSAWTYHQFPFTFSKMMPQVIDSLAFEKRWTDIRKVVDQYHFLNLSAHPNLRAEFENAQAKSPVTWGATLASWELPNANETLTQQSKEWRHPLYSQLSKEGYNLMAEFEAALRAKAYENVCQIIGSAGVAGVLGLLPNTDDPDLLVSLSNAVAMAMREHPGLQRTMRSLQADLGQIRVREAISNGDPQRIEATTIQFYGTSAAAIAHRWLGDRAFSSGRFAQAIEHYQAALTSASSTQKPSIEAAIRLAAAMQGEEVGAAPTVPVQFGEHTYSPDEFEAMISKVLSGRHRSMDMTAVQTTETDDNLIPDPGLYELVKRGDFKGDQGHGGDPNRFRGVDWVARQLAFTIQDHDLIVSNRFQLICYDLNSYSQRWTCGLQAEQGYAHEWPLLSARPLVVGSRIFVRRLRKNGFELACIDRGNGSVIWNTRPDRHVISDPVFARQKLLALIVTVPQDGMLQIELANFHPDSGEILSQRPLMRLRDLWDQRPPCTIQEENGTLICTVAGTVVSCDTLGQPHWLRRQIWVSHQTDSEWFHQAAEPVLIHQEKIYCAQRGVKSVSCLDFDSGQLHWQHSFPKLSRILGICDGRLIVQARDDLLALDPETGEILWEHRSNRLLDGYLLGKDKLIYTCAVEVDQNKYMAALIWLDPATGRQRALNPVGWQRDQMAPEIGPLWSHQGKTFAFLNPQNSSPGQREWMELVSKEGPVPGPLPAYEMAQWLYPLREKSLVHTALVLPGWTLFSPQHFNGQHRGADLLEEYQGEKRVLHIHHVGNWPVVFHQQADLTANSSPRLFMRVGCLQDRAWILKVEVNGETALEEVIGPETTQNRWRSLELDLSQYAGQKVSLVVSQIRPPQGAEPEGFWKTLEIRSN